MDRNAREAEEIDIARTVQEKMFPTSGLEIAGLVVEGWSRPCNETGGDYYAFLPCPGGLVAMVGDVSGHGLGAALFTTMAHALAQQQFRASFEYTERLGDTTATAEQRQAGRDALVWQVQFIADVVAHRRHTPGPDLVSALVAAEEHGAVLTESEIVAALLTLYNAAGTTTFAP
jgi:hypothetical protein